MREILRTPHYVTFRDDARPVALLVRTSVPLTAEADMAEAVKSIARALPPSARGAISLLVDLREGPLRTDPEFEKIFPRYREEMLSGFKRVAVLVRTAVGKLQVNRHAREEAKRMAVFDNEQAAWAFVAGG